MAGESHARIEGSFIEGYPDLSISAKWLYVCLKYRRNNKSGDAFPSYDDLERLSGLTRSRISSALKELVAAGVIAKRLRFGQSTVYSFEQSSSSSVNDTTDTPVVQSSSSSDSRTTDSLDSRTTDSSIVGTTYTLTKQLEPNNTELNNSGVPAKPANPARISIAPPVFEASATKPITTFEKESPPAPTLAPSQNQEISRPRDLLFDAVAEVTQSNVALLGSRIGKATAELRRIGATPEQVHQVAKWYASYDWRGKKGEKLTFEILKEVWQLGLKGTAPVSPAGGRTRPQVPGYSEQQRQAAAAESAARNTGRDPSQIDGRLAKAMQDRANAVSRGDSKAVAYFDQMIATLQARANERVTA